MHPDALLLVTLRCATCSRSFIGCAPTHFTILTFTYAHMSFTECNARLLGQGGGEGGPKI
eukprot:818705-Amphidinium_carterae.2